MNLLNEFVQIILPVGLLLWLWLAPSRTMFVYVLQAVGVGLVLLAISLTAIWGIAPWWTPYVYGILWAAALLFRLVNFGFKFDRSLPSGRSWVGFLFAVIIVVAGGYYSITAIDGRQMPEGDFVSLSAPLGPGTYRVANGGSRSLINSHLLILKAKGDRRSIWKGQSFGVDLIQTGRLGFHKSSLGTGDNSNYEIFGARVLSPCKGEVIASRDGLPDNPVGKRDIENKSGNFVFLVCQGNDILLAHLKSGSIGVKEGDLVEIGDQLGQVGNSGQSDEPHLHIHAQDRGDPGRLFSGTPLPIKIDGRFLVRNDLLTISGE